MVRYRTNVLPLLAALFSLLSGMTDQVPASSPPSPAEEKWPALTGSRRFASRGPRSSVRFGFGKERCAGGSCILPRRLLLFCAGSDKAITSGM